MCSDIPVEVPVLECLHLGASQASHARLQVCRGANMPSVLSRCDEYAGIKAVKSTDAGGHLSQLASCTATLACLKPFLTLVSVSLVLTMHSNGIKALLAITVVVALLNVVAGMLKQDHFVLSMPFSIGTCVYIACTLSETSLSTGDTAFDWGRPCT